MNLRIFLKKVDEASANLSHENLEGFVHEIARTLPEKEREDFIKTLQAFQNPSDKTASGMLPEDDGCSGVLNRIAEMKDRLMEINDGSRMLDSEYNEEWDDWYNSDVDEVLFTDPEGIVKDIETAIGLVHSCIDMEMYQEGSELAELLSVLEVSAEGDYNDIDGAPLSLYYLSYYKLLSCDFKECVKECLYLAYMGSSLDDRADKLFCMIENFECRDIKLEDILQTGNRELPDINEFLLQWIDYLGNQTGIYAEAFLKEAQGMIQDDDILIENARKYVKEHPALYEEILCKNLDSGKDDEMFHIGMEALGKIPVSYAIRGNIALLSAEYACKRKDYDAVETCWLEAFRSDTKVVNYFRIRFKSRDWMRYKAEVESIYEDIYKKTAGVNQNYSYTERRCKVNTLQKNEYCVMLFFDGQFDKVLNTGMNEKKALGWSYTFMKQGLALFLLLLLEGEKLSAGLNAMLNLAISACSFDAAEYAKGTEETLDGNSREVFWKLFCLWKNSVQLSEREKSEWMDRIDKWIAFRVEGIMENNRRNYYGECAAWIAAFGEVQESMGAVAAKDRIMEQYKSKYSRRRAFHQELRGYGMRK